MYTTNTFKKCKVPGFFHSEIAFIIGPSNIKLVEISCAQAPP